MSEGGRMLTTMTKEEHDRLKAEFVRRAEAGFDWMFDPNLQADMRTFVQIETRAMNMGTDLIRWAMQGHLDGNGHLKASSVSAPCPECGRSTQPEASGARDVESRAGRVAVTRSGHSCPSCRRRFFPSGS